MSGICICIRTDLVQPLGTILCYVIPEYKSYLQIVSFDENMCCNVTSFVDLGNSFRWEVPWCHSMENLCGNLMNFVALGKSFRWEVH